MDRLSDEERAIAWESSWHPSFDGQAIVEMDGTFRSVNPQFCELLGVTPADLIGKRFQDITPPGVKELDETNAKMVVDGLINFYILPKRYQFADGREIDVNLLVTRVPVHPQEEFQFFLSRIMLDERQDIKKEVLSRPKKKKSGLDTFSQKQTLSDADFLATYSKWLIAIGAIIASAVATFLGVKM